MEFEDHDQQEESLQGMESLGISPSSSKREEEEEAPLPMTMMLPHHHHHLHHHHHPQPKNNTPKGKYRECLKNHAVSIGGHALDGCGEFMPAGPDGSLDALKCAACNCHRNFHRKESYFLTHHHHHAPSPAGYLHVTGQQRMMAAAALALPMAADQDDDDVSNRKKRFRTKFTAEQKEKMVGLAERIGWRIQKQDEDLVKEFSEQSGIKRQVFKVWMHNNKLTLANKKP